MTTLFLPICLIVAGGAARQASENALQTQVIAAERAGLDALKSGDLKAFGNLTADDAIFVDDHGPATKAEVLKNVANFKLVDYAMEGIRFVALSRQSGLIAYKITERGSSHGHDFTAQAYVSSVWTRRGGKWQCQFSQESAAK